MQQPQQTNRRMSRQNNTSVYLPTLAFEGKVRQPAVVLPSSQSRISSSLNIEPAKCINTSHLSVGHINHKLLLTKAPSSARIRGGRIKLAQLLCKLRRSLIMERLPHRLKSGTWSYSQISLLTSKMIQDALPADTLRNKTT